MARGVWRAVNLNGEANRIAQTTEPITNASETLNKASETHPILAFMISFDAPLIMLDNFLC